MIDRKCVTGSYLEHISGSRFCSERRLKDWVFSTVKTSEFSLCYCRKTLFLLWACLKTKGKWSKRIILKLNSKKTTWHCGQEANKPCCFHWMRGKWGRLEFKETEVQYPRKKSPPVWFAYLEEKKIDLKFPLKDLYWINSLRHWKTLSESFLMHLPPP